MDITHPRGTLVFSNCENRDVDLADFTSFAVSLSLLQIREPALDRLQVISANSLIRSIVVLILILSPRMTWADS